MKSSLGKAVAKKTSPFLTPLVHQVQGIPEHSDPSLHRWNNGRRGGIATTGTLVHVAPNQASAASAAGATAGANGILPDPLLAASSSSENTPTKGRLTPTATAAAATAGVAEETPGAANAPSSSSSSSSSSSLSSVRIPFVDSGYWRGSVVGHRIIAPLPSWGVSSADEEASEETMAKGMEVRE